MEPIQKRQKIEFKAKTLEDLPEEIILKIFGQVNIKDLFQCMAVSKKIRAIAKDQSLWNKIHLTAGSGNGDIFPAELIPQILAMGCQYLALYECHIMKKKRVQFSKNFQLKYLCTYHCSEYDPSLEKPWDSFDTLPDLAASCYNLEKLSIESLDTKINVEELCKDTMEPRINRTEAKFFKCIIQNCDTLKVLNLAKFELNLTDVQRIISLCQELTELKISEPWEGIWLCDKSVEFICNNLTTKIEKLDFRGQPNFGDDQFKTLLKRCNKLTELSFCSSGLSDKSAITIIEHLSQTLVKLDGTTNWEHKYNLQLASMPKLQVLCGSASNTDDEITNEIQDKIIRKMLPNMSDEEFYDDVNGTLPDHKHSTSLLHIAEPYPNYLMNDCGVYEYDLVPNGFWEIKAKQRTYNGFHKLCKRCGVVCKCTC